MESDIEKSIDFNIGKCKRFKLKWLKIKNRLIGNFYTSVSSLAT